MTYNLNNLVIIFYSLFAISLPFNAFEWDIVGIDRFEIKITMITFILLFVIWVLVIKKNGVKFLSQPLKSAFDPVKTCFCYDPDNTIIQFVEITDSSLIRDGLK